MSIQSVQSQAQNASAYQIHKTNKEAEAQATEQVQSEQAVQQVQQADEYDKANPVGTEAEGVYSVSYDEDGNMKVNYSQPSGKSDVQAGETGGAQAGGESSSAGDTDSIEDEIECLKKQRDQIKQQLNKAQDEEMKKALRTQLQMIEAQIAQKTAQLKG